MEDRTLQIGPVYHRLDVHPRDRSANAASVRSATATVVAVGIQRGRSGVADSGTAHVLRDAAAANATTQVGQRNQAGNG